MYDNFVLDPPALARSILAAAVGQCAMTCKVV